MLIVDLTALEDADYIFTLEPVAQGACRFRMYVNGVEQKTPVGGLQIAFGASGEAGIQTILCAPQGEAGETTRLVPLLLPRVAPDAPAFYAAPLPQIGTYTAQ